MKGMSNTIKEVPIPGGESKKKYLYIDDEPGLFGLVQIGVLEIHDWGVALAQSQPARPHRVRSRSRRGARLRRSSRPPRSRCATFSPISASRPSSRSTGGKGLHVVAPLTPKLGWDEVKGFAKAVADALVDGAARPLHGEHGEEGRATGQDLRRLSPQSARRHGHLQLLDPRAQRARPVACRSAGTS